MYLNISETRNSICLKHKIYIWSVTIRICRSSFITLYCILTNVCPFLSLQIYTQSILDNMLFPLYKSYTNGGIFFKLDSNVHPNWTMCRTHLTLVPALSRPLVGYESHSAIVLVRIGKSPRHLKIVCRWKGLIYCNINLLPLIKVKQRRWSR